MRIIVIVLTAFILSCKPKSDFEISQSNINAVPDSVIAVDDMIDIITDIHLAEAWVVEERNDSVPDVESLEIYYAGIYRKHGITDEKYKSSFAYFTSQPALMNYVYSKVTENLNLLESQHRNSIKINNSPDTNEQKGH